MISGPGGPPKKAERLIRFLADYQDHFGIQEDMDAVFEETARDFGLGRARRWYWRESLFAFARYMIYLMTWGNIMLKNYLKTAVRNMRRQKVFSIVNIFGLSLGLASCILILLFVSDELSFDRFHDNSDRLYVVVNRNEFHDRTFLAASMGTGPVMERDFPEVERVVRISDRNQASVRYHDHIFNETPLFVDPCFFEVFSFPLIVGQSGAVLQNEGSIVLTERTAGKYFGPGKGLGEVLSLTFGDVRKELTVSGICRNPPTNSTIRFDLLVNINNLRDIQGVDHMTHFRWFDTKTFVLLKEDMSPAAVNDRFPSFTRRYFQETIQRFKDSGSWTKEGDVLKLRLEGLRGLHLNPEIVGAGSRSIQSSLILAAIGILILIIACINFVNLSIGRASTRKREAGMRRVLGARPKQLINQFWAEALVLSFLAMAAGMLIAFMILPVFNRLAEKQLEMDALFTIPHLVIFLTILVSMAVVSGSFPGLLLSRLDPAEVMKAKMRWTGKNLFFRSLIIIQFALAAFLLVMTFTMAGQFRYISRADLGFNEEGIVVVDLQESGFDRGIATEKFIEGVRMKLIGNRDVLSLSGSLLNYDRRMVMSHIDVKGTVSDVYYNRVVDGYLETMGITLLKGRDFFHGSTADSSSVIVNEAFVEHFGLDDPLGLTIYDAYERDRPLKIVGIIKDFHFQSLKHPIAPVIIHKIPEVTVAHMLVRIRLDNIPEALDALKDAWNALRPEKPFLYSFLDQDVVDSYKQQKRWMRIVTYATILAVFISCMGVFAMTVMSIARRIKEIAIRRVLGADLRNITGLIGKDFLFLVVAANVAVGPFAYLAARRWLQGFAFRTSLSAGIFGFALLLSLFIAMTTVGALALRTVRTDPARNLHRE